jgi:hypothetical protein
LDGQPGKAACQKTNFAGYEIMSAQKTLHEIEDVIGMLCLPERLRLYRDTPQSIGRSAQIKSPFRAG